MDRGVWQAIVHSIKRVQHDWSDLAHTHQVYILVILIFGNDNEIAQTVNCLSTTWETWVRSLGWEDPLKKEMATHSSTLAFKIPWTEELGAGYCPCGRKESGTTERLHFHLFVKQTGEKFKNFVNNKTISLTYLSMWHRTYIYVFLERQMLSELVFAISIVSKVHYSSYIP